MTIRIALSLLLSQGDEFVEPSACNGPCFGVYFTRNGRSIILGCWFLLLLFVSGGVAVFGPADGYEVGEVFLELERMVNVWTSCWEGKRTASGLEYLYLGAVAAVDELDASVVFLPLVFLVAGASIATLGSAEASAFLLGGMIE